MFKTTFNFFFNQEIATPHMVPRGTGDPPHITPLCRFQDNHTNAFICKYVTGVCVSNTRRGAMTFAQHLGCPFDTQQLLKKH